MDTYADTYTTYRAELDYRRERLIAGLASDRSRRHHRHSLRSELTTAAPARTGRPDRSHFARSA